MNIVLIGYRATGKTTVGKMLASRMDKRFVDTDDLIQENAGQNITDIVADIGWEGFRELEKQTVAEASRTNDLVIATGGGVVLDEANVRNLSATGKIFWLKADIETIMARLKSDGDRPPLSGKDAAGEAEQILTQRLPAYEKAAHWAVETETRTPHEIVKMIIDLLSEVDLCNQSGVSK